MPWAPLGELGLCPLFFDMSRIELPSVERIYEKRNKLISKSTLSKKKKKLEYNFAWARKTRIKLPIDKLKFISYFSFLS